jgi:hypothetical protein
MKWRSVPSNVQSSTEQAKITGGLSLALYKVVHSRQEELGGLSLALYKVAYSRQEELGGLSLALNKVAQSRQNALAVCP